MPLCAAKLAVLAGLQLGPLCRSEVMRGAGVEGLTSALHGVMSLLANMGLPSAAVAAPTDAHAQAAAALLFCWALLGWLLPTLLLLGPCKEDMAAALPPVPSADFHTIPTGGDACIPGLAAGRWLAMASVAATAATGAAATRTEACLQGLLGRRQQAPAAAEAPPGMPLSLRWLLCLQLVWLACCAAAPLTAAS
ncbi:hypothetical protein ABPG75_009601 [Micractinium tetrahymenae]